MPLAATEERKKALQRALEARYGQDFASNYQIFNLDGKELKNAEEAQAYAYDTGEVIYLQGKNGDKIPIALTDKEEMKFALDLDVPMPKKMAKPEPPQPVEKPKKPGFFSRLFSGIKKLFTGSPTETMRKYNEREAAYQTYQRDKETYERDMQKYQEQGKLRDLLQDNVEKIKKSRAGEMLKNACKKLAETGQAGVGIEGNSVAAQGSIFSILEGAMMLDSKKFEETKYGDKLRSTNLVKEMMQSQENRNALKEIFVNNYDKDDFTSCINVANKMGDMLQKHIVLKELNESCKNIANGEEERVGVNMINILQYAKALEAGKILPSRLLRYNMPREVNEEAFDPTQEDKVSTGMLRERDDEAEKMIKECYKENDPDSIIKIVNRVGDMYREIKEELAKPASDAERAFRTTAYSSSGRDLDYTCQIIAFKEPSMFNDDDLFTRLMCYAMLIEKGELNVNPFRVDDIYDELDESKPFQELLENENEVNELKAFIEKTYKKGDFGSCLKIADKVGEAYNRFSQKEVVKPVSNIAKAAQKTASKSQGNLSIS